MFKRKAEKILLKWKKSPSKKPLILRGARQVGKTTLINEFAKNNFPDFFKINFDKSEDFKNFEKVDTIKAFKEVMEVKYHKKFNQDTLIFIDEIQNLPNIIKLLRFFYEEEKEVPVIAAGSLLEVKIKKEGFSMPVGRVQYAYLYPLTFFEFLQARGEDNLLDYIKEIDFKTGVNETLHRTAKDFFLEYLFVGGMPEAVNTFLNKDRFDLINVYQSIFQSFSEDLQKYSSNAEAKYLRFVFENAPFYAGSLINYQRFADSEYRTREMQESFETLNAAMVLNSLFSTGSKKLPISAKTKRSKKLIFLDSGLVNYKRGLNKDDLTWNSLDDHYRGSIFEQIIGQNLKSVFSDEQKNIYYWSREKTNYSAEVDFCFEHRGKVVGLEVKSGKAIRARSLLSFADQVQDNVIIRIYPGPLCKENVQLGQKKYSLISMPFYLINRVLDFV